MRFAILFIIVFIQFDLVGQYDHESVFPELEGESLKNALVDKYKPTTVLSFADAKDSMYRAVYQVHDSVKCVYTGHKLFLDKNSDPSVWLYQNGGSEGINAEHTYPKSKGAGEGNALSNLYNLFPTRTPVNSDRANLPFGEIEDTSSDFWYYLSNKTSSIPNHGIDNYSEINHEYFEPREDHKGNVARAIFYFYSMYEQEALQADPSYFEQMRSTLCDWHYYDPVDSLEWERNWIIAGYQSGKANPYILDCSLAGRSYCDYIDPGCTSVETHEIMQNDSEEHFLLYPNPVNDKLKLVFNSLPGADPLLKIYSIYGNEIMAYRINVAQTSLSYENTVEIDLSTLLPGVYVILMTMDESYDSTLTFRKVIIKK